MLPISSSIYNTRDNDIITTITYEQSIPNVCYKECQVFFRFPSIELKEEYKDSYALYLTLDKIKSIIYNVTLKYQLDKKALVVQTIDNIFEEYTTLERINNSIYQFNIDTDNIINHKIQELPSFTMTVTIPTFYSYMYDNIYNESMCKRNLLHDVTFTNRYSDIVQLVDLRTNRVMKCLPIHITDNMNNVAVLPKPELYIKTIDSKYTTNVNNILIDQVICSKYLHIDKPTKYIKYLVLKCCNKFNNSDMSINELYYNEDGLYPIKSVTINDIEYDITLFKRINNIVVIDFRVHRINGDINHTNTINSFSINTHLPIDKDKINISLYIVKQRSNNFLNNIIKKCI